MLVPGTPLNSDILAPFRTGDMQLTIRGFVQALGMVRWQHHVQVGRFSWVESLRAANGSDVLVKRGVVS